MSTINSTFNERVAVVATIDPDAYADTDSYDRVTDAIDMSLWGRVAFIVLAGDLEATALVDFKVTQSDAADGTFGDLTDKAVMQLTTVSGDKQMIVEVRSSELTAGKRFIRGELKVGTADGDLAVIALGLDGPSEPASEGNLASVAQVLA